MSTIALVSEHASPLAALGGADAGGQNVYVACLAGALARRGHTVTVYTRRTARRDPARVRTRHGYSVQLVDAGPPVPVDKDRMFGFMDEFEARLSTHLRIERPGVVHSHFWMSGRAAVGAAARYGIPVVHSFHALGAVKQRHQKGADTSPPERLRVETNLLSSVGRVVATCRDEVAELLSLGADPARLAVVPCGFDQTTFRPDGVALPRTGRARIAAVSRLVPRKGLADAIVAVAQLRDAELVVAGGPAAPKHLHDPYLGKLLALAESHHVADRVHFLGGLPPGLVAALDRSADLCVHTPWYEPFGIAPVEAMGCGVPVVGSAVGGLLDTVVHDETGLLVPPRDPDALASAMHTLLADSPRRRRLGARASWRARSLYTWPVVAAAMEGVYAEASVALHQVELHA